jgi:hypothetical protein
MIKFVWKPYYYKSKPIFYELVNQELLNLKKGTTGFKVIWTCDNSVCKTPNKIHSINASHLNKEKLNQQSQICRPCQCSGEGNGRYGDRRKWKDFYDKEKLTEIKLKYSEKWKGSKNPSLKDDVKIKKNQNIINENFLKKIVEEKNFKIISISEIKGKHTQFSIECEKGHVSNKVYTNFTKKNIKYICKRCLYESLGLNLTDEELIKIENYRRQIRALTAKNYKINKEVINPKNLKIGRGNYHLDHKFSIHEGFKNNLSPHIISALENLEILTEYQNCSKQSKCSITLEELIEKTEYLLKNK